MFIDANIESGRYRRLIQIKADKFKDDNFEERYKPTFKYIIDKLTERFKPIIAGTPTVQFFEQHGTNVIDNEVTAVISFEYIIMGKAIEN